MAGTSIAFPLGMTRPSPQHIGLLGVLAVVSCAPTEMTGASGVAGASDDATAPAMTPVPSSDSALRFSPTSQQSTAAVSLAGHQSSWTLTHGGRPRRGEAFIPYQLQDPTPVVFMFHGGGGRAKQAARDYRWNEQAAQDGFIVMYPEGTGATSLKTWNAGHCCGDARDQNVDDVGFVRFLVEAIRSYPGLNVDPSRIYATGFSNGAVLTHRFAGHAWPGGKPHQPQSWRDHPTQALSATEEIAAFFLQHQRL